LEQIVINVSMDILEILLAKFVSVKILKSVMKENQEQDFVNVQ